MKKVLALFLIVLSTLVNAQQTRTPVQFGDDTWVNVPLQFAFPFYGKIFTNSFMFSNGVVAFYGLQAQPETTYCCNGEPVNTSMPPVFNYTIMPMQTDLLPVEASKFYTEGDSTRQKYIWQDIAEYSNRNNLNSFSVEIKPTGYIGIQYDKINIQHQYVTSAIIGDASKGEYILHHHGLGMNSTSVPSLIEHATTLAICSSNPLADPSCPGFAQAYHDQQCSSNALYATTCPGYEQAYFNQQCSNNPLYASTCAGYAQAYFNQQCSINPLYASTCTGYEQAYFNQQCSLDALYNKDCTGYSEAYAKKMLLEKKSEPEQVKPTVAVTVEKETSVATNQPTETTSVTSPTSVSPASVTSVVSTQPIQPVSQLQPVSVAQTQTVSTTPQQQTQKQQEERKTENQVASKMEKNVEKGADKGKMKEAVAKVQKEISKEVQEAKTIEAQVATQGLVVGSMNYVPGFDAYKNALIPDVNAMLMARQYEKPVVDNRSAQRRLSGSNELRWQQMVESQYQIGK